MWWTSIYFVVMCPLHVAWRAPAGFALLKESAPHGASISGVGTVREEHALQSWRLSLPCVRYIAAAEGGYWNERVQPKIKCVCRACRSESRVEEVVKWNEFLCDSGWYIGSVVFSVVVVVPPPSPPSPPPLNHFSAESD